MIFRCNDYSSWGFFPCSLCISIFRVATVFERKSHHGTAPSSLLTSPDPLNWRNSFQHCHPKKDSLLVSRILHDGTFTIDLFFCSFSKNFLFDYEYFFFQNIRVPCRKISWFMDGCTAQRIFFAFMRTFLVARQW